MKKILTSFLLCLSLLLCGCIHINISSGQFECDPYDNADAYNIGGFDYDSNDIKNIEINWIVGNVEVSRCESTTCTVKESTNLEEDYKLRWLMEGDTLTIQYCKSGLKGKHKDDLGDLKTLEIEVPDHVNLTINNNVGEISLKNTITNTLTVVSDVGDITGDMLLSKDIQMNTDVGDINVSLFKCNGGFIQTDTGEVMVRLLGGLGATIDYSSDLGEYNGKDEDEGTDIIGDGSCHLTIKTDIGNITVEEK